MGLLYWITNWDAALSALALCNQTTQAKGNTMKAKEYLFTETEIAALREATCEEYHRLKGAPSQSGEAWSSLQKNITTMRALYEQFRDDLARGN